MFPGFFIECIGHFPRVSAGSWWLSDLCKSLVNTMPPVCARFERRSGVFSGETTPDRGRGGYTFR